MSLSQAVQALRALIEDWGFVETDLEPFLQPLLIELLRFGKDAYEIDSQLQTFGLIALMIDTLGDKINPHLGTVVGVVPHLWEAALGHGILRLRVRSAPARTHTRTNTLSIVGLLLILYSMNRYK